MTDRLIAFLEQLNRTSFILIFLSLGLLLYGNMLGSGFVGDDLGQVKYNRTIRSITNVPMLFKQGTFDNGRGNQDKIQNHYKPLLSATFAFIYLFSGDQPWGFHLIQILLHSSNAILIYAIFKRLFDKTTSFFLALLFLVHPLNTEAVNYISALQEPLFVLFGLLAIYISMSKHKGWQGISLITTLLIASLLSKETGIVFLLIVPLFSYLERKHAGFRELVPSVVAILIYVFLRLGIAQIGFHQNIIVPIMALSLGSRIIHIPKIIFFYLSTFVYPKDLFFSQSWTIKSLSLKDFYIPLLVDSGFVVGTILLVLGIYRRHRPLTNTLLFFIIWLAVGLGLHLQLIPLDQTVSDRWFYFPMIGLLGIIGILTKYLGGKKRLGTSLIIPIMVMVLMILAIRVIVRNTDWQEPMRLYTHDLKYDPNSFQLESAIGNEYVIQNKIKEVGAHYARAAQLFPGANTMGPLGTYYVHMKRFGEAQTALDTAVRYDPSNGSDWIYLAIAKYKLGNKKGALEAAKKAYEVEPNETTWKVLKVIENNEPINIPDPNDK